MTSLIILASNPGSPSLRIASVCWRYGPTLAGNDSVAPSAQYLHVEGRGIFRIGELFLQHEMKSHRLVEAACPLVRLVVGAWMQRGHEEKHPAVALCSRARRLDQRAPDAR